MKVTNVYHKNTALLYDDLYQKGGGEKLFLQITHLCKEAKIYVPIVSKFYRQKLKSRNLKYSFILSFIANNFGNVGYKFSSFLSLFWFESLNLNDFELVLSVSNRFSHCVITPIHTKHICLITSPFRQIWEQYNINPAVRFFYSYLRIHNYVSARRPNTIISISNYVQGKIKKYWGLNSIVINPPIILSNHYFINKLDNKFNFKNKDYFLLVGRLNGRKSKYFERVIKIFNKNGINLVVVGNGGKYFALKNKYKQNNIYFLGEIDEKSLFNLYKNARALIHPQIEDFGLTPLESLHFGTPVIAYNKGGVTDYLNNKVSFLYDKTNEIPGIIQNLQNFKFNKKAALKILKLHSIQKFEYNLYKLF
ncbi:hypothetical protein COV24_05105 [candidate division WWE3 bacterium CG10_big_fil_rev_8_21_14_0_10_32_10]|uniref:Glycosyl transferase family 1 domain-containing protein n=1 Tax=candidate division WWE3 bacterium CG10_big_fil_rev_8_21_14_0_10_32_10 TaxID=1975090 RepID=A0A2H0R8Z0_UNCKA|nr:MAG: hypothetical protein COV24_05105 [candidate division WWE3 bacterium CG10_big_fil_rev_8_21_14_0_10_32_10]